MLSGVGCESRPSSLFASRLRRGGHRIGPLLSNPNPLERFWCGSCDDMDSGGDSAAALTWHDFLERMRQPSAVDFVKSIKSFIVSFLNKAPYPEKDSAAVQEFLFSMEGAFRAHTLWAGSSEEALESAGEGLEKYVMTKLYNRAFASLPEDVKHDEKLYEKIALVQQFVRPENLDIKPSYQNETSWLLAQKELQKINMYKAPRDKLVCILNCCKVINNLLLNASIASNDNPPGADEFLPVLIYVIIKANPPQLHLNLLYIQRYRHQSRLVSESAYFFTNVLSAESFIWGIDAHSLSMDETEFQKNIECARAHLLGLSNNLENNRNQLNQEVAQRPTHESKDKRDTNSYLTENAPAQAFDQPVANKLSKLDFEKKGATDVIEEDHLSQYFYEYPFLYAHAGDLTVDDVESLLNSYKQLVVKYVSLSKGIGIGSSALIPSITQVHMRTETSKKSQDAVGMKVKNENYEEFMTEATSNSNFSGRLDDKESKMPTGDSVDNSSGEKGDVSNLH